MTNPKTHESGRVNAFERSARPTFQTRAPDSQPATPEQVDLQVDRIADDHGFPSRQAPKRKSRQPRKIARHRTGRNQQLNMKVTTKVYQDFYKVADRKKITLGELLEQALAALEEKENVPKGVAAPTTPRTDASGAG